MLKLTLLILMQRMLLLIRLKLNKKITGKTGNDGTKIVEIMVPLKNLSNFWRILEMPLINCEINVYLNWPEECVTMATAVVQIKA